MRTKSAVFAVLLVFAAGAATTVAQSTEQDIINRYLKKKTKTQVRKLGWVSANFTLNRINRNNDYNKFANYSSNQFSNTSISWLGEAKSFGIDLGLVLKEKIALSVNGEYWLKLGENQTGAFDYTPPDRTGGTVEEVNSEIKVWGVSAAVQYYLINHPTLQNRLDNITFRVGGSVGYYEAKWSLWPEYQNLNLSTSTYEDNNMTYKGSAPGIAGFVGVDYPLNILGMSLGVDFGYMYLNFKNIAWYNSADEEIIVTYSNSEDSRVNLGLSGFRGKVELKRFFTW
jgi:hypothetical protein